MRHSARLPEGPFEWTAAAVAIVLILLFGAWLSNQQQETALRIANVAGCRNAKIVDTTSIMAGTRGCFGKHAIVYDISGDGPDERPMKVAVCCRAAWGCDQL